MNLILLFEEDFVGVDRVCLRGRRLQHVLQVHRAQVGECLCVGRVNGRIGEGEVLALDNERLELRVSWRQNPPPALPVTLLLAMPRPKMLRRIIQTATAMGVKRLILINSYRVEKSYWQTPFLRPQQLHEQVVLGLEQAKDTVLPEVVLEQRFKPFVEDRLPALAAGTQALVAHPKAARECPRALTGPVTLAVGPEGGFIPYEVDKLEEAGFSRVHLGPRILRVENAVPALLARLF